MSLTLGKHTFSIFDNHPTSTRVESTFPDAIDYTGCRRNATSHCAMCHIERFDYGG
ncbi:hypothetical protein Tcur_4577 [Thermomonospora curvata DSM 43183]|uniref:Uncharacterized protein n=1 Tax=Thermomonospora curvata (strain ATCC 19995 / DSM 43183 / JCM 3096 / KCTC 9072 / NBRC 15933 / NCIMB 10081 / Henssen B9) TaxID=471852 RepID=D1A5B3_THECD|nr:hypothetical protein Tcur_4577 [Thermomonospora curvata DSM 43183]